MTYFCLIRVGYNWVDIAPCVQWMAPYATTLREAGQVELKFFTQVPADATHNIQTHAVDLNLLVGVALKKIWVWSLKIFGDSEN